jgi:hypothetical protein
MPIPLGILAVAGASAGGGAAYEFISTGTGTGSSGTITFASIPSDYKHLQIRGIAKGTNSSSTFFSTGFNSDSGTGYHQHNFYATQTNTLSFNYLGGGPYGYYAGRVGSSAGGDYAVHSAHIIDILDYSSTAKNKTVRNFSGIIDNSSSGEKQIGLFSVLWVNTSAITSVNLVLNSGSFATGTRFSLYGIRG